MGECRNGRDAVRSLDILGPDLVFLDVQMPGLDGFGVIRTRGVDRMPAVVFVTAHDEFAVRAFEANAIDYLVKPLSQERFDVTVARVRERMRMKGAVDLASRLAAVLGGADTEHQAPDTHRSMRLVVPTATGQLMLDAAEIDWIEARDFYAGVHTRGTRFLVRESLRSVVKRLDPALFFRTHRGAIVRLDLVRELMAVQDGGAVAVLRDGARVPVSRRRVEPLRALLRQGS